MTDINWKKDITKLPDSTSKLLYLVYYLYKINEINDSQKIRLKKYILENKVCLNNWLNDLIETNDLKVFIISIKSLFKQNFENANHYPHSILFKALISSLQKPQLPSFKEEDSETTEDEKNSKNNLNINQYNKISNNKISIKCQFIKNNDSSITSKNNQSDKTQ